MIKPFIQTKLPDWIVPIKRLVLLKNPGRYCQLPYLNHPKGCPKYNKDKKCPTLTPSTNEYFDLSKPLYFVHSKFDYEGHVRKMKKDHPDWSDLQCQCVLYWQGTSRRQMKERRIYAMQILDVNQYAVCPEGMGVNIYVTARLSGLKLDRVRYLKTCRHITLLGTKGK